MYKTMFAALGAFVLGASASSAAETRYDFEFTLSGALSTAMTDYGFASGQTYGGQVFWDDMTFSSFLNCGICDRWDVSVDFTDNPGGSGILAGFVAASTVMNQDAWDLGFDLDGNSNFVYLQLLGDFGYTDELFVTPADRPVLAPPDATDVASASVSISSFEYFGLGGFAPPTRVTTSPPTDVPDVPLPTTAPLLAGGLFAIGWAARRRRGA